MIRPEQLTERNSTKLTLPYGADGAAVPRCAEAVCGYDRWSSAVYPDGCGKPVEHPLRNGGKK